ncbi:TonB-linked SusC/RagA family outer membrane protein [Dysgonomonas hofstadii]|uniref:TonB-linked SusC/RagA family outer membrane protein n=2 Tax=Dysgonomonas hofstadii TaxID=637886 RepID=A0A840CK00_9BACT|nr:TonB-linked SusC/RagA family outer membrane protein [Dysgonomonas hofstadii]
MIKRILSLMCISLFLLSGQIYAQQKNITGTVKDSQGEPLIGVTVSIKGTTKGTMTDIDGKYTLSVTNDDKTLVATYVGMKPNEKAITGTVVDFTLEDLSSELEEVVVIGYGTVKRKDLTGSVSSVQSEAIQAVPVSNVAEAIAGKMAGVQITATEGSPDAEMRIRVRGGGSITGDNTPLFIVDGFPVESISDIPSSDIESIDVLKDASSTAIYGSRGANGVVIVNTKSGKEGKISVNYNAFYSWKTMAKKLNTLGVEDYVNWQYELAMLREKDYDVINPGNYTKYFGNYQDMDMYDGLAANDWQDQVFGRTGHTFNHSLSISGGSEKTKYSFNYSHVDDKAIMEMSNFKRDNLSLKLNSKPSKRTTLDFSIRYSNTDINGGGANESKTEVSSADSRMKNAMIYSPLNFADLSDGYDEDSQLTNPLVSLADNDRKQNKRNFNYNGSFGWEIFDNFRFKTEFGLAHVTSSDSRFYGVTTYHSRIDGGKQPIAEFTDKDKKTFRNTNTVNYDFKKLLKSEDHHLNLLGGQEYIKTKGTTNSYDVRFYPSFFTSKEAFDLTTQGTPYTIDRFKNEDDVLFSFFSRVNYDYQSKYLFSATFRADGSSKFAEGNRWGYFPSAAVAWRISSETFMDQTRTWLEDLKLRASYGTAGNNNIPEGQYRTSYSSSSTSWVNNETSYWGTGKRMSNPDLKWETTYTRNIGLDYTLFGGKISGSFEGYWNTTKDLLMDFNVRGSGYDTQYRNMGETQNKGFEATINWNIISKKDYGVSFGANIGFNKNRINSLGVMDDYFESSGWASTEIIGDYRVAVHGQVGEIYGYQSDGRYEASDFESYDAAKKQWILKPGVADASEIIGDLRPGSMKLKNTDGSEDNKVTAADRSVIGNVNPVHTGGFNINGYFKGFDLSANFTWSYGNDVYNANKIEYTSTSKYNYRNMLDIMQSGNRWTNLRPDGTISNDLDELAAMNANTTMWSPFMKQSVISDWAVEDGSFLRLNTLTLGYTLPQVLLKKISVQNLRFYVTGYNLFCITSYSGFDPEVSTRTKSAVTPGVDYSAYPKSRQFVVGLNLTF